MSLAKLQARLRRVHWSIWTLGGALALYSALGFWAVPAALRYTITNTLSEKWQRPASVGDISFNPFEMELRIADFSIANEAKRDVQTEAAAVQLNATAPSAAITADAETSVSMPAPSVDPVTANVNAAAAIVKADASGVDTELTSEPVAISNVALAEAGDLIRFESLHINLHVASFFKRQLGFEVIELTRPYIRAEIDTDGELELLKVFVNAVEEEAANTNQEPIQDLASAEGISESIPAASSNSAENLTATSVVSASAEAEQARVAAPTNVATNPTAVSQTGAMQSSSVSSDNTTESESSVLPVWLAALRINEGEIDYLDHSRADFAQRLLIKKIEIEDFHTVSDERSNKIVLQLNDADTGDLSFTTEYFRLQPFALRGQLEVSQLALAPVWQWLNLPLNFALDAPVLDLRTHVELAQQDRFQVNTSEGHITLTGTQLAPKDKPQQKLIALQQLIASDISLDLAQQSVVLGELTGRGLKLEIELDKQGNVNLLPMFSAAETPAAESVSEPNKEESKPWAVKIVKTQLRDSEVLFSDHSPRRAFQARIAPIDISLGEFEPLNLSKPFDAALALGIQGPRQPEIGKVKADASVQISPLKIDADVDVDNLPLVLAQPYAAEFIRGRIARGTLDADVNLQLSEALRVQADANIHDFRLQQLNGRASLLSLDKLAVEKIDYQAQRNSLAIQKIALDALNSSFRINEDGSTNVADLFIEQPSSDKPAGKPLQLAINTIAISRSDLGFADHTLSQNFQVAIKDLSGAISNITTAPNTQAAVNLQGKVDHYAPALIKGTFNVFGAKPQLDMGVKFDNVELTSFTPYSGTYAGFNIERGQLDIDLHYQLQDNKIAGNNRIVMDQFTLGEKVESDKAVDLPLRLALALLRDEKGMIDLAFEVNGDLEDPSFSIGGILWKVLSNIVKKAVASPMKALGVLGSFGSSDEANAIEFTAGSAALTELAMQQAAEIKNALEKRSEFRLNLQGNIAPDVDRLALQRSKLAAWLAQGDSDKQQAWLADDAGEQRSLRRQLAKVYERKLNKSYDDALATTAMQFPQADEDERELRTFNSVFAELAVQETVDESALRQLAMDRAIALRAYMTDQLGFAANRVMVVDYNTDSSLAGHNCLIQLGM